MILLQGQALEILGGVAWHGPETKEMQEPIPPPARMNISCGFVLSVMVTYHAYEHYVDLLSGINDCMHHASCISEVIKIPMRYVIKL
jgi:hypothetical protein